MLLFDFNSLITELCDYYEHREPKPGTKELWFEKLKSIPKEALPWIIKKICSENEAFPKNPPAMVAALFFAWRETHPDKKAHDIVVECPDCDDGTLVAWKIGSCGHPTSNLFRCGRCRQNGTQAWTIARRSELIAQGYEVGDKDKPGQRGSLKQLVEKVASDGLPF